jgi:hypothetical protein
LTPFAQAAFNTPFGRDCTKDMGAFRRSPRSWDEEGAPQQRRAASCADYFTRPKSDNLKLVLKFGFKNGPPFPLTDSRGRA